MAFRLWLEDGLRVHGAETAAYEPGCPPCLKTVTCHGCIVLQVVASPGAEDAVVQAGGVFTLLERAGVDVRAKSIPETRHYLPPPPAPGADQQGPGQQPATAAQQPQQPQPQQALAQQGQQPESDVYDPGVLFPLELYEEVEGKLKRHGRQILHANSSCIPLPTLLSYRSGEGSRGEGGEGRELGSRGVGEGVGSRPTLTCDDSCHRHARTLNKVKALVFSALQLNQLSCLALPPHPLCSFQGAAVVPGLPFQSCAVRSQLSANMHPLCLPFCPGSLSGVSCRASPPRSPLSGAWRA